ncbi:Purkinje cell protein 2 [Ophiophagus hannah]|uniref:Purkinje cell protein 2 n=1 Tax=Ophiophagus hannah TaxID=8665 RepID=V8PGZ5_OPHHA|nr:Purkinje cell protein 2 [Ophiophagus hannah]
MPGRPYQALPSSFLGDYDSSIRYASTRTPKGLVSDQGSQRGGKVHVLRHPTQSTPEQKSFLGREGAHFEQYLQEGSLTMTTVEAKAEEEDKKEPDSVSDTVPEAATTPASDPSSRSGSPEQEGFFNLLTHVQGGRMDEQRCNIQIVHGKSGSDPEKKDSPSPPPEMDNLMEMLAHTQSRRMDDQRVSFNYLPGFQSSNTSSLSGSGATKK